MNLMGKLKLGLRRSSIQKDDGTADASHVALERPVEEDNRALLEVAERMRNDAEVRVAEANEKNIAWRKRFEEVKEQRTTLTAENERFRAEIERLRVENEQLRADPARLQAGHAPTPPAAACNLGGDCCKIEDTAQRGITLEQLRGVATEIRRRCVAEGWTGEFYCPDGTRETRALTPSTTNLYHLTANFIKPMTAAHLCSYVEMVARGPQTPLWFVSHWWGEPVLQFLACIERHAADHGLDADTAYWVCAYANNQHMLEKDVTTNPVESSFARAIELAEGRVLSVLDDAGLVFTRVWCCFELVLCRELALPAAASSAAAGDSMGSSQQALSRRPASHDLTRRLGLGTYEMYTARPRCEAYDHLKLDEVLRLKRYESKQGAFEWKDVWREVFAVLPVITDRKAVGLTEGPTGDQHSSDGVDCGLATLQNRRQQSFPLDLIMRAFRIRVQDADTSEPSDKRHILNYMVGRRGDDLELETEKAHKSYDAINAWLHGCFACHAFRRLLEWGDMDMRKVTERVRQSGLETLRLSFRGCDAFTDEVAELLVDSLPPSLEEIQVEMAESSATAAAGRKVLDALQSKVELPKLTEVMLGECLLTGPVPSWFGECVSLEKLVLQRNALMGPIPPELGKCVQLQHLAISNNQLSGPVPEELLANCRQLRNLFINNNQLTGSLPTAIGQCTQLCELNMCANQLTGTIPEELGQCTALTKILLNRNKLNGAIPASLGRCLELRELYLSSNQLSGAIPAELGQCVGLATLSLGDNRLACCPEGRNSKLPAALGNCLALTELKVDADIVPNNERDLPQPLQLRRSEGSFELHAITSPSKSPQVRPV